MTTVLKLGGSVVTVKAEPETVDDAALGRAAEAVAASADDSDLVVVHGGGSFGHHHADRHGVSRTRGTRDAAAALAIHGAMKRLNAAVVDRLREAGASPLPVHPLSLAARDDRAELDLPAGSVGTMLAEGFVPVAHGDGVAHAGAGVTVLSGDELVVELARRLDADRVGVCSTVPGVLDDDGDVVAAIDSYEAVAAHLGGSESTDVTGGMAAKVRELLALDAPASIFGLDDLEAFLAGERVGTRVG